MRNCLGLALQQNALQIVERQSAIQNILDKNDVEAFDAGVQIFGQAHLAGALLARAVAGYGDEIQRNLERNLANQVGKENRSALQHADQVQALAPEIARDFLPIARMRRWIALLCNKMRRCSCPCSAIVPETLREARYCTAAHGKAQVGP